MKTATAIEARICVIRIKRLDNWRAVPYLVGMNSTKVGSRATTFRISNHAVRRYRERFAGNVTNEVAAEQLTKITCCARRKRTAPGGAFVYGTHNYEMVVKRRVVLTVYGVDSKRRGEVEA